MKKNSLKTICFLIPLCWYFSCAQIDHNNITIKVSESQHSYKLYAHYNKNQTWAVDNYINNHLGKGNNISFSNTRIDAHLTLDDGTKFYMNKSAGTLEIKFNKDENSISSYIKIKDLAEGLKPIMNK